MKVKRFWSGQSTWEPGISEASRFICGQAISDLGISEGVDLLEVVEGDRSTLIEDQGNISSSAIILQVTGVTMTTEKEMTANMISGMIEIEISKRTTNMISMKEMKEILKIVTNIMIMKSPAPTKTLIKEKASKMIQSIKARNSTKRNTTIHFSHQPIHKKEQE